MDDTSKNYKLKRKTFWSNSKASFLRCLTKICFYLIDNTNVLFLCHWQEHFCRTIYISNSLIISRINFILQIHKGHTYEKCCLLKILWSAIHLTALSLQCFEVKISQREPWKKYIFIFHCR